MYGQQNPYSQYPYTGYTYPNYGNRQFMQPQQQMGQPQPQIQPQQPMQYETPIQDIRFVTSEEAKAFIVMPNSKALLIDKSGGVAHLKTADNMGQSVTQYFKFEQVNADGTPNTAHSLNPVPIVVVSDRVKSVKNGILADVAPTVLDLMGLAKPAEMTGESLVELL